MSKVAIFRKIWRKMKFCALFVLFFTFFVYFCVVNPYVAGDPDRLYLQYKKDF